MTCVSASEPNPSFRKFAQANHTALHWHSTMQDQLQGAACVLHAGESNTCHIADCDYMVIGSPCNPFSVMSPKRFHDGTVKAHSLTVHTFGDIWRMLMKFNPPTATMEQTEGFTMAESKNTKQTPLEQLGPRRASDLSRCNDFSVLWVCLLRSYNDILSAAPV